MAFESLWTRYKSLLSTGRLSVSATNQTFG